MSLIRYTMCTDYRKRAFVAIATETPITLTLY